MYCSFPDVSFGELRIGRWWAACWLSRNLFRRREEKSFGHSGSNNQWCHSQSIEKHATKIHLETEQRSNTKRVSLTSPWTTDWAISWALLLFSDVTRSYELDKSKLKSMFDKTAKPAESTSGQQPFQFQFFNNEQAAPLPVPSLWFSCNTFLALPKSSSCFRNTVWTSVIVLRTTKTVPKTIRLFTATVWRRGGGGGVWTRTYTTTVSCLMLKWTRHSITLPDAV